MSVSLPLPPSGRDFLAYHRIVVDNASTRAVADELQISQTRVRQIVHRVIDWMRQNLPEDTDPSEAALLRVARHIAADRLERYYCEADRAWRQTGEPKYANLALKVITAQTKLPAMPGTIEALAMDSILGPLPDPTPESQFPTPTTSPPPSRDCSPARSPAVSTAAEPTPAPVVTPSHTESSGKLLPKASAARTAFLAPAHPADSAGDDSPVTQLKITPHQLGLTAKQNLSRRERRRLRRRIELSK